MRQGAQLPILRTVVTAVRWADSKTMSDKRALVIAEKVLADLIQAGALPSPDLLDHASQRVDPERYRQLQHARYMQTGTVEP